MPEETGRLRITAERGGTVSEIIAFLSDLEAAYMALYVFNLQSDHQQRLRRFFPIDCPRAELVPVGGVARMV